MGSPGSSSTVGKGYNEPAWFSSTVGKGYNEPAWFSSTVGKGYNEPAWFSSTVGKGYNEPAWFLPYCRTDILQMGICALNEMTLRIYRIP